MSITLDDSDISVREVGDGVSLDREGGYPDIGVHEQNSKKREDARWWIALIVVLSLAFIVLASFFSLWCFGSRPVDDIVKVIDAVTSPVIGIVGAVTGFYFGEAHGSSASADRRAADSR